jgi:serine/threonine protein kinase
MELMEENLSDYLEELSHPVPYHIQVNICYGIASALSYLHANDIVVRDVHSGDILLARNAQVVKLSDLGASAFDISNRDDISMCPGIDVYLPREAVADNPKYTDKVDCFSFGVVMIQILTREYPRPGDRMKYIDDPKFEFAIPVPVPEIERWKNYISKVDRGHPLLLIVLDCIKDIDVERPTAHELYERIGALKESPQYRESSSAAPEAGIRQQEQSQEEIHRLKDEIRQNQMLIEEVFENAKQQQKLAVEIEVQNEQRHRTHLEQQLMQSQAETRRIEQQCRQEQLLSSQKQRELAHTRQQMTDLQQQIRVEQQRVLQISRTEGQLQERIRELERRLEQSEVEALGSRVSGLQLLPQGDSWNVPRREVRIIEQIGEGGSCLVSKGNFQDQTVAVKQIHRWIMQQVYVLDEFKREVGIMATIQHPNLVRFIAAVFDERVDQRTDSPLLVLELLHINLRNAYSRYDLGPSKSVPIFRDVAYGLHYLHEHSEPIIHRDVSAPNILLESLPGDMWRAKLSDFGSANFLKRAKTLGVGAIVYTAPEMFPRASPSAPMPRPTTKCDVFSYGIVVVEVVTKTMPTTENRHQLFGEVERKWRFMYDLVSRCTEVSPHARPTMADILNTLNRIPMARPR